MRQLGIIGVLLAVWVAGCQNETDTPPSEIAVSNSYLHAIVRDLCGDEMAIFSVVPPGMCPGHFDIRPSDVQRLFACRLLLAFDFQRAIGDILPENGRGPAFHTVDALPGMCIPDTYLSMAQQTADILTTAYPERAGEFQERLDAMAERMTALASECAAVAEQWELRQAAALTSRHQAAFVEWLGITTAATFSGGDSETAANINAAISDSNAHRVRWIIANRQEGTQLAEAMADRLGVPVVVFSNFPAAFAESSAEPAFDAMVRDNLRQFIKAAQ